MGSCAAEAKAKESGLQILPVSCLDVCPRGAVAVALGATRGRGPAETMVIRTPEEFQAVCDRMVATAEAHMSEPGSSEVGLLPRPLLS